MDAMDLPKKLERYANELKTYARDRWPRMAAQTSLRFIDGNFRAQGWQGRSFKKWKANQRGGTILVKSGRMRASFRQQIAPGYMRVYTNSKAARVHNQGFIGKVTVRAHSRRRYTARRVGTGRFNRNGTERKKTVHEHTGTISVKQHVRNMNMPKRQFMPNMQDGSDAPVLINAIIRKTTNDLRNIVK